MECMILERVNVTIKQNTHDAGQANEGHHGDDRRLSWRLGCVDLLPIVVVIEFGCLKSLGVLSSLSNKRNNSSSECIITERMVGNTIINW